MKGEEHLLTEPLQLAEFATEAIWLTEAVFKQIDKIKELAPIEAKLEKALQKAFYREGKLFLGELESLRGFFPENEEEAFRAWFATLPADELRQASKLTYNELFAGIDDEPVKEAIIPPWYTWPMILALLTEAQLEAFLFFVGPIDAAVLDSMVTGAYSLWAEVAIEPTFSLAASPEAVSYLQQHGASMVTKIDETTRGYIKTQVQRALDEGWSYNRTAKAITNRYKDFAIGKPQLHIQSRAHLVAITEVGNAYEQGGWEVAQYLQSQGLPMEKYWSNVGDDKVSDGCLENTAAGWIPLNDPFPSGHMRPLRFPGCRCGALYQRIGVRG